MASEDSECAYILVEGVPKEYTVEQLCDFIDIKNLNVFKYSKQTEEHGLRTWTLQVNQKDAVELCENVQSKAIDVDGCTRHIVFRWAKTSHIQEEWIETTLSSLDYRMKSVHHKTELDETQNIFWVKLLSLPEVATEKDYLQLYFEEKENVNDHELNIETIHTDTANRSAVVKFENSEDAEKVLEMKQLRVEGKVVSVMALTDKELQALSTIEVKGPTEVVNEKNSTMLRMYFQNTHRSGGGKIINFSVQSGRAFLTFESSLVSERVVKREKHLLRDCLLQVKSKLSSKNDLDDNTVYNFAIVITPIPENVNEEYISLYFEQEDIFQDTFQIDAVKLNRQKSSAVVVFRNENAVYSVMKTELSMEEQKLDVHVYNPDVSTDSRCTIAVTGPVDLILNKNLRSLKAYFQDCELSGGGAITCCSVKHGVAYFVFMEEEAARKCCARRNHCFQSQQLKVALVENNPDDGFLREKQTSTVKLEGLSSNTDADYLSLFLENTSTVPVKSVKIGNKGESALVEFESGVDTLIQQGELKIKGTKVKVLPVTCQGDTSNTIEVTGEKSIEGNMETLEQYFRSERNSGGGTLTDFFFDHDEQVAYFTFECETVAKRVAERDHTRRCLKVRLSKETANHGKKDEEENNSGKSEKHSDRTKTVKVEDKSDDILPRDILVLYFEHEVRSGGGKIDVTSSDDIDEHVTYLTFQDSNIANTVAARQHTLDGHQLLVSLYVPPPFYDDKFLLKGLAPTTTKECLFNFLEAITDIEALTMTPHAEKDEVVLVTMKSKIDFDNLENACQQHTLEDAKLQMSRVPVSHFIQVDNLAVGTTKDTVMYFFQKETKSEVESVTLDENKTSCVLRFRDYKVIAGVLGKKYTINGQNVAVTRYFQCIKGPDNGTGDIIWKQPNPIQIKSIDPHKIRFFKSNDEYRKRIESQLGNDYINVDWSSELSDTVLLRCLLDKTVPSCGKLAKTWTQLAKQKFSDTLEQIDVCKINVPTNIWEQFSCYIKDENVKDPECVAVFVNQQTGVILVGECDVVTKLAQLIRRNVERLKNEDLFESQSTTDTIECRRSFEVKLLRKVNIIDEIEQKYGDIRVKIDEANCIIDLEGPRRIVKTVKKQLEEKINTFLQTHTERISDIKAALLQSNETIQFVHEQLEKKKLTAEWEIEGQRLVICSTQNSDVEDCEHVILSSVVEKQIRYDGDGSQIFETMEADGIIKGQQNTFRGKVEIFICRESYEVSICATKDVCPAVVQEIERFICFNTKVSKKISGTKEIVQLIDKYYKGHLLSIMQKFQNYKIEIVTMENFEGFEMKGLNAGIDEALAALEDCYNSVHTKHVPISKLGVSDYVESGKGKDSIHTIESSLECVINVKKNADQNFNSGVVAVCEMDGNRQMNAWHGDMTDDLKVDALVVPQDNQLNLHGALGTAIRSKGGPQIEKACTEHISKNGDFREGDVFISVAGNIDVAYIVHMVSPEWQNNTENEKERLIESICNCLHQVDLKKRGTSIAIPAIGCGNNNFPTAVSTTCIVQAVKKFFLQMPKSRLKTIYLCDVKMETVISFAQSLVSVFGLDRVVLSDKPVTSGPLQTDRDNERKITPVMDTTKSRYPSAKVKSRSTSPTDVTRSDMASDEIQFGQMNVTVVRGQIADQQVNVIVNTTSADLDLNTGSVSRSLYETGGKELQEEINAKYPKGIQSTQIAVTEGHNLKCNVVLHIALDHYGKNSIKDLNNTIKECLKEVKRQRLCSIAFPALGTGVLEFPRDIVATEMFKAVSKFSNKYPDSSVKDVRFVVYHKDIETIQAFEQEITNLKTVQNKKRNANDSCVVNQQQAHLKNPDKSIQMFGNVNVSAKKGDLTKEHIDCIVNSTNLDLDFSTGEVSQVLKQKCGKVFLEQVMAGVPEMKQKHLLKTSAPELPCKLVFHIDGQTSNWQNTVEHCLKEADKIKMTSIAFPALGGGLSAFDLQKTAREVMSGVRVFANSQPKYLKDVRFLIFDVTHLKDYMNAIEEASDSNVPSGLFGKIFSGVKTGVKHVFGKFGTGADGEEHDLPDQYQQCTEQQTDTDSVTFVVYATSDGVIDEVVARIYECIEKEIHTKTYDDSIIHSLNKSQISEINDIAKHYRVYADIDTEKGVIMITGISENVYKVGAKLQSLLSDATHMDLLSNVAQWCVIYNKNGTEDIVPYERDVNLKLERAYKSGQKSLSVATTNDTVVIDFRSLEEFPEYNTRQRSKVIRRDLTRVVESFATPSSWGQMEENLKVVYLQTSDKEYQDIEKKFNTMSSGSYVVKQVDRIQNKALWEQYQSKKKQLESKRNPGDKVQKFLWHGTKATSTDSINAHGFNRSYCGQNATVYGLGVYFDTGSTFSCGDAYSEPDVNGVKKVYYCRVLTGEYTVGNEKTKFLPKNPKRGNNCIFDSVVDDDVNPELFVIFHDSQAYPEYIVSFTEQM